MSSFDVYRVNFFLLLATAGAVASGCQSATTGKAGHYEGSLIERSKQILVESAVQGEVSSSDNKNWTLEIKGLDGHSMGRDDLSINSKDVMINLPSQSLRGIILNQREPGTESCWTSGTALINGIKTRVCDDSSALLIEISDLNGILYSLSLHQFSIDQKPPVEVPTTYTLDEAMKRTLNSNFLTVAQFQKSMEAAHVTKNAYLNLLPRLNINTIISAAKTVSGGYLEILGVIGDVAPFLLPTRWIAAKNAGIQSVAEKLGLLIVRGDMASEVESLAYNYKKDGAVLADYASISGQAQTLVDQIRALEPLGRFPLGTADSIQTSVNGMKEDFINLSALYRDEKATLSQLLGFTHPDAVTDLELSSLPVEADLENLDATTFENLVVSRSLELAEIDQLVKISKNIKTSTYFQWLDPSGDPNASLGAALPSSVEINKDHIAELGTQRAMLQSMLMQKARTSLESYRSAEVLQGIATADHSLQKERLDRVLETLQLGKSSSTLELVTIYQDLLRSAVIDRNAQAATQIARVKMNRLLLEGYYSKLNFVSL